LLKHDKRSEKDAEQKNRWI